MAKLSENLGLLAAEGDDVGDEDEDTRGRRREEEGGSTVAGCMNADEQSKPLCGLSMARWYGPSFGGTEAQRHDVGARSRLKSSLAAGCVIPSST